MPPNFSRACSAGWGITTSLHGLDRSEPDAIPPEARDARALITIGSLETDAALMDALPKLGLVACYGTGYEGVDRAAARARGIVVTHAGDTNSTAVAEFAMGLVIASARGMMRGDRFARAGRWRGDIIERSAVTPELAGQRLGIYGLGSIGAKIATRAAAFEMEIGYHNRRPRPDVPYVYHPTLMGLAEWADVLMVAVRADASNTMRSTGKCSPRWAPGATWSTSRAASPSTRWRCARRWRPAPSPAPPSTSSSASPTSPSASWVLDNVVLTPHMAAISANAQRAQRDIMFANLEAFFAGRPVLSPVPE